MNDSNIILWEMVGMSVPKPEFSIEEYVILRNALQRLLYGQQKVKDNDVNSKKTESLLWKIQEWLNDY